MNELKNSKPIIIGLVVLVIGLTIGLVLSLTNNNNGDKDNTSQTLATNKSANTSDDGNDSELYRCDEDGNEVEIRSEKGVVYASPTINIWYKCKKNEDGNLIYRETHQTLFNEDGSEDTWADWVSEYVYSDDLTFEYVYSGTIDASPLLRVLYIHNANGNEIAKYWTSNIEDRLTIYDGKGAEISEYVYSNGVLTDYGTD